MIQKGDPYTKLFNTLSPVTSMSCILSQLNILCSSLVKLYYIKITTYPLFTIHTLRSFYCSAAYLISSKRSDPYIKTFNT